MAKATHQMKLAWLKTVEAVGNTASKLASSARVKAQEIRLETRKRELLMKLSGLAFRLWQEGQSFPAALEELLKELGEMEEQLNALREAKIQEHKEEENHEEGAEGTEAAELTSQTEQAMGEGAPSEQEIHGDEDERQE